MQIRWLVRSQSIVTLAAGMVYPYYLLFLKNLGNSYSKYGLAFAVFTISSAVVSQWLGPRLDRLGSNVLVLSSIGMMIAMLGFPWVTSYYWVILLQLLMGTCSAMQKMGERLLLADLSRPGERGPILANYQFWTSIAAGFAIILGGYVIDWLTIHALFYVSAVLYAVSAWVMWRHRKVKSQLDQQGFNEYI